ncbi:ribonuclease H-like domain-containing protein, partial [Usnea florida]
MEVTIVDSKPSVVSLIDDLEHIPTQPPSLYLDVEGVNLSRHGSISIVQLFVLPKNHVFLIDVFVLGEEAFNTSNGSGTNLRSILESALVPKVFFDVRNDSDALFAHFQISLQGIQDIQLLENATRYYSKDKVVGLAMCIERDAQLTPKASTAWKATKESGRSRFDSKLGGSYQVFNCRPILHDIIEYCTQDVVYLPRLWRAYTQKISKKWMRKVEDETRERVRESQTASYEPHGKHKTLSP